MKTVSQLLEALDVAARANRRNEFDQLERELLSRFEGGFEGMPVEIYDRYLEVDRAWPVVPLQHDGAADGESEADGLHRAPVGPPVELTVELPEELVSWLAELGDRSGYNRSRLLCECLQLVRVDKALESALRARLAKRRQR